MPTCSALNEKATGRFLLRSFSSRRSLVRVPETMKASEEMDDTIDAVVDCNETLLDLASGSKIFRSDVEKLENNMNVSGKFASINRGNDFELLII